ncbi:MAG: hypothetical protein AAGA97_02430 [Pseudomonadota bacterium]
MTNKPLTKIKDSLITATVWHNKTDEGKDRYSVDLSRSYEKDNQWHDTNKFGPAELLRAARLAEAAYDFIRDHRQGVQAGK